MKNFIDLSGHRFTRLRVLSKAVYHKGTRWHCICDCGNKTIAFGQKLRQGLTKSCGCLRREKLPLGNLRHGYARKFRASAEYRAYCHAKERCNNPNDNRYHCYGARGITFLFATFEEFIEELGPKPHPALTLDRVNNDGNYERGNCRWATRKEQAKTNSSVKRSQYATQELRRQARLAYARKWTAEHRERSREIKRRSAIHCRKLIRANSDKATVS